MLRLRTKPHDGGAKEGRIEMSLARPGIVVGVEQLVGRIQAAVFDNGDDAPRKVQFTAL